MATKLLRWLNPQKSSIAVDHDNQYIFIHVPKTAGTSVRAALRNTTWPQSSQGTRFKVPKHATARETKGILGEHIWHSHFTFAFTRNPWDLMASSYCWWLRKGKRYKATAQLTKVVEQCGSFREFILSDFGRTHINECEAQNLKEWYCDRNGQILVDFIGRVETLNQDIRHIGKELGVTMPQPAVHNVSDKPSYREFYDDETRQVIADRFAWTIQHFGYEF